MTDKKYITRGVLLSCDKGSHYRRMNLIKDHGIGMYIDGTLAEGKPEEGKPHPFVIDTDIMIGDETTPEDVQQNISWFGVCECCSEGKSICLKPDERKGTTDGNVTGHKCKPIITGNWENAKDTIEVQSINGSGHLLTTDSYLICNRGGIIKIVTDANGTTSDGTDYWDES